MKPGSGEYLGARHVSSLYIEDHARTWVQGIPGHAKVGTLQAVGGSVWIGRHCSILSIILDTGKLGA